MSLIEILLLGILIMQIITFHTKADSYGRYMKLYDIFMHRCPKYLRHKTCVLCKIVISRNEVYWFIYKWTILIKESINRRLRHGNK